MVAFTPSNLKKIEDLFKEVGYEVRYEKGNFNSGYCILESRKVVVVNKYFQTEARINTLLDILFKIPVDTAVLSNEIKDFYIKIRSKLTKNPALFEPEE
ncbi:MAG: hypothetical protein IPK03_00255 [Bacteroidetes bacterium]|nr:hypothetical protein [Bacteroidota bacterium]